MKPVLLLLLSMFSCGVFASIDDITGAFGIEFGEILPKGINCMIRQKHVVQGCSLSPPKPFISFNKYRVSAAKVEGLFKIHSISGFRKMGENYLECTREAGLIAKKLETKYNISLYKEQVEYLLNPKKYKGTAWSTPNYKHNKNIYLICDRIYGKEGYYRLYISYEDPSYFDKAVSDLIDMTEIRNSDDSGL